MKTSKRPGLLHQTHRGNGEEPLGYDPKGVMKDLAALRKNPRLKGPSWRGMRVIPAKRVE